MYCHADVNQENLFVLFLFINIKQTFNIDSLLVGINIDKHIKSVHSNQEKVIDRHIYFCTGLPQSLHKEA